MIGWIAAGVSVAVAAVTVVVSVRCALVVRAANRRMRSCAPDAITPGAVGNQPAASQPHEKGQPA